MVDLTAVEVDGTDPDRTVLVECWAQQGTPDAEQVQQVLAAAFKLTWAGATLSPAPRLVLCCGDRAAAANLVPGAPGWVSRALQDAGVSVVVVTPS